LVENDLNEAANDCIDGANGDETSDIISAQSDLQLAGQAVAPLAQEVG
jgi:hypothetical protein